MAGPFILKPIEITDAVLISSTLAEPAAGETAWASGGSYTLGDERIRIETHRVYRCIQTHAGRSAAPESDPMYWQDISATERWKMFDEMVSSQTISTSDLTIVLQPGMFNAVALYNLTGASVEITVKDRPGGATIYSHVDDLYEPWVDWYEWLFGPYLAKKSPVLLNILPYDTAELTITIRGGGDAARGIGMVVVGDMKPLVASGHGGARYGVSVEPIDYSYIKTDEFGNTKIVRRAATTGLEVEVLMEKNDVDYAVQLLQDVLATPVAFVTVDAAGYQAANVFGLISGRVRYAGPTQGVANISVKGLI